VVRTIQTESIPAAYALSDTTVNNRLDVLERYRQEVLELPAEWKPRPRLRIKGADHWRYAPMIWEALDERRWIAAGSPTKYITLVANSKLQQRKAEEEKEHVDARLVGGLSVPIGPIIEKATLYDSTEAGTVDHGAATPQELEDIQAYLRRLANGAECTKFAQLLNADRAFNGPWVARENREKRVCRLRKVRGVLFRDDNPNSQIIEPGLLRVPAQVFQSE
jgi:hypothetical protein